MTNDNAGDRVIQALRTAALAAPAGERLPSVRELMAQHRASPITVQRAVAALAAEGLVERVPNRGARVRVVTTEEAVAITEARMALEALIARKAAERAGADDAERLRAHLGQMRAAVEAGDLLKYSALIQQLHGLVRELAAQPVAAALIGRLQAQLVRHQFRLSLRPGRPQVSLRGLTALVEAIADGDPDRAQDAAVAHFRSVIAALSEPSPGGPA